MTDVRRIADEDVKLVLDNCRLDYVFEPDWERLLARVCDLLASAKTVAWWQDCEGEHPPQAWVLADPAARFVRDNVNVYLLGCPVECPLPSVAEDETEGALRQLMGAWRQVTGRNQLVTAPFLRDRTNSVTGPRMAVQAFFSSAIDALVIGRFLLMKDYWLMRMPQGVASGKARESEIRLLQARA